MLNVTCYARNICRLQPTEKCFPKTPNADRLCLVIVRNVQMVTYVKEILKNLTVGNAAARG